MAEELPDGTYQGYYNQCDYCKKDVSVNLQGGGMSDHICKEKIQSLELRIKELEGAFEATIKDPSPEHGGTMFNIDVEISAAGGYHTWQVEAKNKKEAIAKFKKGDGDIVCDQSEVTSYEEWDYSTVYDD